MSTASETTTKAVGTAILLASAGNASKALDAFASWLLAGFGAAVALLLTNQQVQALVPISVVRYGSKLFLLAVVIVLVQKYISVIVVSAADGAALGREVVLRFMKEIDSRGGTFALDGPMLAAETLKGMFPPARWVVAKMLAKAKGDVGAGARLFMKAVQIQGALVLLEVLAFLLLIWHIAWHLPGT